MAHLSKYRCAIFLFIRIGELLSKRLTCHQFWICLFHIRYCNPKENSGITQEQLAETLGVSAQSVSKCENYVTIAFT